MALDAFYLGDTSALARLNSPDVFARVAPLVEAGLVARCTPTDLEAGYSSRDSTDHRAMREHRSGWPLAPMDQSVLNRAIEVQDELARRGRQRAVSIVDLLVSAAAEASDLVVLHYDHDFDMIAEVTSQPTQWVVPAGSVA